MASIDQTLFNPSKRIQIDQSKLTFNKFDPSAIIAEIENHKLALNDAIGDKFMEEPPIDFDIETFAAEIQEFIQSLSFKESVMLIHQYVHITGLSEVYFYICALCGAMGMGWK